MILFMKPPELLSEETLQGLTTKVCSGQKLLIYAILLNLGAIPLRMSGDRSLLALAALVALVGIVLSILGTVRLSSGLGYGIGLTIVYCILMLVPLVSLIVLLVLNSKATAHLRAAGYNVGLFGASKNKV